MLPSEALINDINLIFIYSNFGNKKIKIKGLIGLKSEERKKQNISGFSNLEQIAKKSLEIAADLCIYTNDSIILEKIV